MLTLDNITNIKEAACGKRRKTINFKILFRYNRSKKGKQKAQTY
jgi:hypothetical protein